MESMIRDIKLAPSGHDKINWVKNFMPVMAAVDKEFSVSKPFAGKKMVITLHLEAKTAYMAEIFHHAGAEVAITGSNPLSTQDDVAAALVEDGALSEAAAVRAREIARSFSHTRPSGASFSSALSESGVSYLRAGENIASGQKSASEVVNAWMNSPGHRANILNSSYSRIGSASVNIDGTLYWVQLFAD